MDGDLAEAAGERLVLGDIERLVAEEDDAMLVERVADLGHRAVVEILRDVDAGDLGAAGAIRDDRRAARATIGRPEWDAPMMAYSQPTPKVAVSRSDFRHVAAILSSAIPCNW